MSLELHVGDVGVPFQALVLDDDGDPIDYSGVDLIECRFQKPDGSMLLVDGVSTTADVDGASTPVVRYYFADGDLDADGLWRFQLRVVADDEVVWSPIVKFKVKPNLPLGV